jgi:NAD(P)-dependent dehydrogenase (short-subunit alcohol dehydrogenase family)
LKKVILLTGATDGIGLVTAQKLTGQGHQVLIHGRSADKLARVAQDLGIAATDTYLADLSIPADVDAMASAVLARHEHLDVLINNAGILKTSTPRTTSGMDVRFLVNTIAPYRLARLLLPAMDTSSRIINLSSAAQAPVDINALQGNGELEDMPAYSQSKLAITMWSRHLANEQCGTGPVVVSVNPGSLLASKMVQEGFGIDGNDINIGADILVRAAVSEEFSQASGQYFDNDKGQFGPPHPHATDDKRCAELTGQLDTLLERLLT